MEISKAEKPKVYITGHRVPDTDSICSAIAYAELKNRVGEIKAIPVRLGELNQETRFVMDYFNVDPPLYLNSIQPLLSDAEFDKSYGISGGTTLYRATEIIQSNHQNSLGVVNDEQKLIGVISLSEITKSYASVWNDNILGRSNTPLSNVIEVLSGKMIFEPKEPRAMVGDINIYAMSHVDNDIIKENDIVLVGDRPQAQQDAVKKGVSLMIVTNNAEACPEALELAEEYRVTIISTGLSTYIAARLLPQAVPVSFLMTSENLVYFHLNDYLEDVREKMATTRFRSYPVVDGKDRVVGSISRYHLINTEKKKVILVDHNEAGQSIADLDQAEILEIIDHHRVANITTSKPIYFRNLPVGCTSTILSQMYYEQGIRPTKKAAGLMCAAIISDTLLFKSPTTTEYDKMALARMAPIAGIDPEEFAMEMFKAGTDLSNKDAGDILTQDVKFFDIHGIKMKVAQIFSMDSGFSKETRDDLFNNMEDLLKVQDEDTYVLIITDIFKEDSMVMVAGKYGDEIAAQFGSQLNNHIFIAKGLLSRKKQMLPALNQAVVQSGERL